ncbi:hypothetical protein D3C85_1706990 [compost metagenome]
MATYYPMLSNGFDVRFQIVLVAFFRNGAFLVNLTEGIQFLFSHYHKFLDFALIPGPALMDQQHVHSRD